LKKFICTFASYRQEVPVAAFCASAKGGTLYVSLHDDKFLGKLL